jgi:S1-C subfamily serine protease
MDGNPNDILMQLSAALADRVDAAAPMLAAIGTGTQQTLSGILWRPDAVVTSEQALPDQESYSVILHDGTEAAAKLAGRDRGTNVAALRLATAVATPAQPWVGAEPRTGALALALGARPAPTARLALVHAIGPAWHSMAGGHIERLIRLDMRSSRAEEGGPVIDATGGLLGMATAGPRRRALVIPHQTIARVLEPLLAEGRVARGWLGVGLQPVAVPETLREQADGQDAGLMVVSLAAGGPAEQAGILPGDILMSLDGTRLSRPREIRFLLGPERVGKEAEIRLLRAGALQACRVTIGARPAG